MTALRILDIGDEPDLRRIPPCADPRFDHRTCDYWEDADRGSKAARLAWLETERPPAVAPEPARTPSNPFLADLEASKGVNPFAAGGGGGANPFAPDDTPGDSNPFAPQRTARPTIDDGAPPKLRLLARGLGVVGSYAKVLLVDDVAVAYAQFGPLTAYPRAQRVRDLYSQLPD